MPQLRNRGKESSDDLFFGREKTKHLLQLAVADMHYLLSRQYAEKSSIQLVGNRYRLNTRQMQAVQGMSAGRDALDTRKASQCSLEQLKGERMIVDGFNLLIVLESALSGAYLFRGQDGCYRDLSSVHGSYKRVQQTSAVLQIVKSFFIASGAAGMTWYFDKPVSNSGRIKSMISELAANDGLNWEVILDFNPDKVLAESEDIVISSDAWILDRAKRWFNAVDYLLLAEEVPAVIVHAD